MSQKPTLTLEQGAPVYDTANSETLGERGPVLLQDVQFIEKMAHFDRERIPERVVHAKGSGAFGTFRPYRSMSEYTSAAFLRDPNAVSYTHLFLKTLWKTMLSVCILHLPSPNASAFILQTLRSPFIQSSPDRIPSGRKKPF